MKLFLFATLLLNLSLAENTVGYIIELREGNETSVIQPRSGASGTKLKLKAKAIDKIQGFDHLIGNVKIRKAGQKILLARSQKNGRYDLIFVDSNMDGSFVDEVPITPTFRESNNKWWANYNDVRLFSPHVESSELPDQGDYQVTFWTVLPTPNSAPDYIRYRGATFTVGSFQSESTKHHVLVRDMTNDGFIKKHDFWTISAEGIEESNKMTPISKHLWSNGKAWKIELLDDRGYQVKVKSFNSGSTEQEDKKANDPYQADKELKRAEQPLHFWENYQEALATAHNQNKQVLIKFETTWCGPCHAMNRLVFTTQDVVDAAQDTVCLKIDGDKHQDLVKKYKIRGYPSLILLDVKGNEIKRASGYQSSAQMINFLKG